MRKRKNPFSNEKISPNKRRKIDPNFRQFGKDIIRFGKKCNGYIVNNDKSNKKKLFKKCKLNGKQTIKKEKQIQSKQQIIKQKESKQREIETEKKMKDFEDETTCCMCYDILLSAHSLGCGHTMCHQCICEWIDSNRASASCPVCRKEIKNDPTPCRTLDNIIQNIHINHLNDNDNAKKEWNERLQEYNKWKIEYNNNNKNQNNNNIIIGNNFRYSIARSVLNQIFEEDEESESESESEDESREMYIQRREGINYRTRVNRSGITNPSTNFHIDSTAADVKVIPDDMILLVLSLVLVFLGCCLVGFVKFKK